MIVTVIKVIPHNHKTEMPGFQVRHTNPIVRWAKLSAPELHLPLVPSLGFFFFFLFLFEAGSLI